MDLPVAGHGEDGQEWACLTGAAWPLGAVGKRKGSRGQAEVRIQHTALTSPHTGHVFSFTNEIFAAFNKT